MCHKVVNMIKNQNKTYAIYRIFVSATDKFYNESSLSKT